MAVTTNLTNKPINPRSNDQSPKGYNRAELYTGKALDFDGVNDYVDLGQNLGFINTGDFTLLANAKFDILSGDEPIMGQGSGSTGNAALVLVNALGKLRFAFYGDDLDWDEPIQTGKWYSLAFTFNRTTKARSIYVNGQLAVSDVTTLTPNATGNTFVIGKVPYLSTYADAQITGVKAFNTALTAAQVADLYNNPEKIVPTGVEDSALKLWLPMMEGAGTTAYDGSGNGNHGTISGATWTHGVGSPVAQSAVISWNKGQNIFTYSEDFTQWGNARTTDTANATTAPDGSDNAIKLEQQSGQTNAGSIYLAVTLSSGNDYQMSVFAKAAEKDFVVLYDSNANRTFFNVSTGVVGTNNSGGTATIEALANDWYKCTITYTEPSTGNANVGYYLADTDNSTTVTDSGGIYLWGPSIALEGKNNSYLPTIGTAQTSDVLLPQGLTSGRDITGVNLFENVRKQGALNLDGNSWAEVHDNASLDITDEVSVECWAYWDTSDTIASGVFGKWTASNQCYLLYKTNAGNEVRFYINSSAVGYTSLTDGWHHIVGTYDRTNKRLYVDGAQVNFNAQVDAIATSSLPLEIGRYDQQPAYGYDDQIAQPRIYNRALTAEEVLQNYNSGKSIYQ